MALEDCKEQQQLNRQPHDDAGGAGAGAGDADDETKYQKSYDCSSVVSFE